MGQLRGLAQAITSGAAKDATGTPIDSAYIAREMKAELAIGRDVVRALKKHSSWLNAASHLAENRCPR